MNPTDEIRAEILNDLGCADFELDFVDNAINRFNEVINQ